MSPVSLHVRNAAFVEYRFMDGVRAAVKAWANGPPQVGVLANIPLHVLFWQPSCAGSAKKKKRNSRKGQPSATEE